MKERFLQLAQDHRKLGERMLEGNIFKLANKLDVASLIAGQALVLTCLAELAEAIQKLGADDCKGCPR